MEPQRHKMALGRGLQSLIPPSINKPQTGLMEIPVEELLPGDGQPRQYFDEVALAELATSIAEHGILQPIIVRKRAGGQYEIVAGERRWRAAQLAEKKTVPCVVTDFADEKALTVALVENIQREDLNPIEEAESFRRLSEELKYTQEQIAQVIGKDRTTVANAIRLLKLPKNIQQFVMDKQLTMGHARALLGLQEESLIEKVARQVVTEGLSVRQTEHLVQNCLENKEDSPTAKPPKIKTISATEKEIRRKLEGYFATRVEFKYKKGKGSFVVHFSSTDQLNDILERLQIGL